MTVDRTYLPYVSAQNYVDRGMAKWMGFFLSEHSQALVEEVFSLDASKTQSLEEKSLLISQIYLHQLSASFYIEDQGQARIYQGQIIDLNDQHISVRSSAGVHQLELAAITYLEWEGVEADEP